MEKTKLGIIGCGNISDTYFKSCAELDAVAVSACADIDFARAEAQAARYGVRALTVDQLLADPKVEIIINLTVPVAHAEVSTAALQAGKHIHTEKPLAVLREDGQRVLAVGREKQLRVGSAPDTFLGGGLQTCRKLIDEGAIGEPVACSAFMGYSGPDAWHPNPHFFFQPGAGPMFDMGPYYLTALIHLLGPVQRVSGATRASFSERVAGHEAIRGQRIPVNVPTHVIGVLEFASGPLGMVVTTFDVVGHEQPRIEIYGSEGTLSVPDPNTFGGPVRVLRRGQREFAEAPLTHGYIGNHRGLGPADMALAIRSGRPHRANGELGYHVLDLMHAFHDAAREGRHIELASTCARPAPLPMGLREGELDD
ncbi:MAG: Gfo/Idh/MocA family protein [Anaerolineales bacterium]